MSTPLPDEPVSIVEQLRFLRPTAKFKFAKDQFYMVGKVMHEAADEIERLNRKLWLRDADIEAANRVLRAVCESSVNGRNVLDGIDKGVADLARYRLGIEVTS